MSTPNLGIAHIAAAQTQKEVTANDAFDKLEEAMCDSLSKAMADANQTLTTVEAFENLLIICTGALTGAKDLVVPAAKKAYIIKNNATGGFAVTCKTPSGTGVAVGPSDGYVHLYCDGTNVVAIATGAAVSQPYIVAAFHPGAPANSAIITRHTLDRAVTWATDMSPSQSKAGTAATASTVFDVKKNGSNIATVTYGISGATGTYSGASGSAAQSDVISIHGPASADATLADIDFALSFLR